MKRPKDLAGKAGVLFVLGDGSEARVQELKVHQKKIAELTKQRNAARKRIRQLQKRRPQRAQKGNPKQGDGSQTKTTKDQAQQNKPLIVAKQRLAQLEQQIKAQRQNAASDLQFAVGVRDAKKIEDCRIHIRGERGQLGKSVPRGFLTSVSFETQPTLDRKQSGRLQLAGWLVHPNNPLTARIAVNRIWYHLFGRGIVETLDNFGSNGSRPTHPDLLDFLAQRFIAGGWSHKRLIREVVLSRTYQLASDYNAVNYAADPENKLHWRMARRRLEAEALRDALLAAGGRLNLHSPQSAAVAEIGDGEVGRGINTALLEKPFRYRSVYLPIIRGLIPEVLKIFDFPEPSNPQSRRDTTNVPAQSLFLMNSPFVIEQAQALAQRVLESDSDDKVRIQLAYQLCFARPATDSEIEKAVKFLQRCDGRLTQTNSEADQRRLFCWTTWCQALFATAEFRYID